MNKIDRRLKSVATAVANLNIDLAVGALERLGLVKREEKDPESFTTVAPLTDSGFERLSEVVANTIGRQFAQAELVAPHIGAIDEVPLIDQMRNATGQAEARIGPFENSLRVNWTGSGALIAELDTPLDMGEAAAAALETGAGTIGMIKSGPKLRITVNAVDVSNWNLTTFSSAAEKKNKRGLL